MTLVIMDVNDELSSKQINLLNEEFEELWKIKMISELEEIDFPDKVPLFIHLHNEEYKNCVILDKQGDLLEHYRYCLVGSMKKSVFVLHGESLDSIEKMEVAM